MQTQTTTPGALIRCLVDAFGQPDAICELLAEDAEWWITPTVGVLGSPTRGRASIHEALTTIFGTLYADVSAEKHHVLEDDQVAACRFTMRATALFAEGRSYENEYTVWVRADGSSITHVWEYLDVAHAMGQLGLRGEG